MHLTRFQKPALVIVAVLFAAASVTYGALWIVAGSREIPVELGFDNQYFPSQHCELVQSVVPGSPAEHAGLKAGDRIIRINGAPLRGEDTITRIWLQKKPGDTVELTVQRAGVASPLVLHGIFRASNSMSAEAGAAQRVGRGINSIFPVAFLTVGLAVLFLRIEDPNAWLMALMFAGFVAIPGFANSFLSVPANLRPFAMGYRAIFNNAAPGLFYYFFAVFPTRSPLDRRIPWLKWISLIGCLVLGIIGFRAGYTERVSTIGLSSGAGHVAILCFNYLLLTLGLVSLVWNAFSATSDEARKKIRVILWGTLVGVLPAMFALGASDFFGFHISLWLGAALVISLWLFPLSFAYAVVKHRVLEIPVLLRKSARYLLVQRGFLVLLGIASIGATYAFANFFTHVLEPRTSLSLPGGVGLGTVFGIVLLFTGARVHDHVGRRIDRAFFRSAYDARVILQDLLEKARTATGCDELGTLLEYQLKAALHPRFLLVYFETVDGQLSVVTGELSKAEHAISTTEPALVEVTRNGRPWEVTRDTRELPTAIAKLQPDCVVPILARDSSLLGLIVLGNKMSEEPYSSEDLRLLAAVANQAGTALESIRLAEKIADRIEAERRTAQEFEFARQVQARLLPQTRPVMATMSYTGVCIPARTVGGDYYDFLQLAHGRLGLVVADIAGKGVPGALLMANLQANLRSQYATAVDDLPRLLSSVNRLFCQSTSDASYATLFFADYDDASGVLRYANCGHLPGFLLRAGRDHQLCDVECLSPTCTVVGMFEAWQCEVAEAKLGRGDMLVLYTDGVTEAESSKGEEFGQNRLLQLLTTHAHLPVSELTEKVLTDVRSFSGSEQQDDITLVLARRLGEE